jgi:hypothetical protein
MLVFIGIGEMVHLQKIVDHSAPLVVGATEADALRVVGEPNIKWDARLAVASFTFGERPAQWIYGTTIDIEAIIIPDLPFPKAVWTWILSTRARLSVTVGKGAQGFCQRTHRLLGQAMARLADAFALPGGGANLLGSHREARYSRNYVVEP